MHNQKKAIVIAAAVGMITTFLPWANVPLVGSINGTEGDGWITFAIFAALIALALTGQRTARLEGRKLYGAVLVALAASAVGVWKIVDLNSAIDSLKESPFGEILGASVSVGIGLYLVVAAGLVTAAVALLIKGGQAVAPMGAQVPVSPASPMPPTTPLPPQPPTQPLPPATPQPPQPPQVPPANPVV